MAARERCTVPAQPGEYRSELHDRLATRCTRSSSSSRVRSGPPQDHDRAALVAWPRSASSAVLRLVGFLSVILGTMPALAAQCCCLRSRRDCGRILNLARASDRACRAVVSKIATIIGESLRESDGELGKKSRWVAGDGFRYSDFVFSSRSSVVLRRGRARRHDRLCRAGLRAAPIGPKQPRSFCGNFCFASPNSPSAFCRLPCWSVRCRAISHSRAGLNSSSREQPAYPPGNSSHRR